MPSGNRHDAATAIISIVIVPGAVALTGNPVLGLAAGVGCLSGLVLTPDLDNGPCMSWAWVRRMGGPLAATLWGWWWYPYSKLFSHRGIWSHGPVVGTLVRAIWFPFNPLTVGLLLGYWEIALAWFTGLVVADLGHWLLDGLDKRVGGAL